MNTQPIEKQNLHPDGDLEVHSVFYTIQGEGPFAGQPCVFVRLAGCNLKCPKCDTDYTSKREAMKVLDLVAEIERTRRNRVAFVVITGGEPFRQNITPLTKKLLQMGYRVQIETNGTLTLKDFPYYNVAVVCSPKAGKLTAAYEAKPSLLYALKYVMSHDDEFEDGLPTHALEHPASPVVARPPAGFKANRIFLQPTDAHDDLTNKRNLDACVTSCLENGFILCTQLHKQIGVE